MSRKIINANNGKLGNYRVKMMIKSLARGVWNGLVFVAFVIIAQSIIDLFKKK